jgi:hypothetical protein
VVNPSLATYSNGVVKIKSFAARAFGARPRPLVSSNTQKASARHSAMDSRHPSFCHGRPHPFIRGSLVRRKTTASGHFEHAEGEYLTLGKMWVSHIPVSHIPDIRRRVPEARQNVGVSNLPAWAPSSGRSISRSARPHGRPSEPSGTGRPRGSESPAGRPRRRARRRSGSASWNRRPGRSGSPGLRDGSPR